MPRPRKQGTDAGGGGSLRARRGAAGRGWLEHYNAACIPTAGMLTAPRYMNALPRCGHKIQAGSALKVNLVGEPEKSRESSAKTHSGRTLNTLLAAGSTMSMP